MSAQNAKKKRIGSRRRVTHQNERSEAEADVSSLAQGHTPEESAESVNVLANPDNSRSESQSPSSPELPGNRRKLGSSRRNKGQHVKSLATEPYHKPREEVEGKNRGNETPEPSEVAHAVQPERQEELRQVTYNSSLYLASIPDNSDVHMPEADLEISVPKIENLPTDQDEDYTDCKVVSDSVKLMDTVLQGVSDTLQSEEVKEDPHLVSASDLSILSVLTCPTVDPQPAVTTVVTQFSSAPEITPDDSSLREQTDIECSVEQAELSSPKEELSANEEQKEHVKLLEDKDAQHFDDNVNKVHDQEIKPIQKHKIVHPSESDAMENSEMISGHLMDSIAQVEHPTKQINFEGSDTAVGQQYEGEGRVVGDLNAVRTVHQEKEGILSEFEESESSVQTMKSEIHAPVDSQHEQSDSDLSLIGNRRKLGSSRRKKVREHVNESVAESSHKPTEEDGGNTVDDNPPETIKMSLTIETAVKEKSMETLLEGLDTFDTHQTEEVSDEVKENEHDGTLVGISELTKSMLHSSSTADEQLISLTNSTEVPEEELSNVYSATDNETKEIDDDTELLTLDGNSQGNVLVSESHLKSEDTESSTTFDTTTGKGSPREHPQPEYSVDQAQLLSPKGELPTNEEQNEMFNIENAQNSDDLSNKEQEQRVKLSYTNEPQIRVDTALGQEYEGEGQAGDDLKPSGEQTVHQEEGIVSEVEDSESSSQTVRSETHAPLDSSDLSIRTEEQTQTCFNSTESRGKSGSSQGNKLEQQVKDSVTESYREHKEDFKVEVSDTSVGVRLEQMDESDTLQSEEVRRTHHSGDAVNKVEVAPLQMQETAQIDDFSESVIHDAIENSEMISGHLLDSIAQVTDTNQPQLMVKSTDDSATNQEVSYPDNKQDELTLTQINFEGSGLTNEDDRVYDTKTPQSSDKGREDAALGQQYEDEGQVTSHSSKDDSVQFNDEDDEEEKKHSKEPEDLCQFAECDTVKMDSLQSDWKDDSHIENISCHDDNITAVSVTEDVPEEEGAFHVQNTEVLYCDKDSLGQEMKMQFRNDAIETVGDVTVTDFNTGAETSLVVQQQQDEVKEKLQDSTKKEHEAQEMSASQGDPLSASHSKNDTLASCDTGLEENFRAEQADDSAEESGLSTVVSVCASQHGTQESEDLQEKSKKKKRKMGSTRRTLSRKPGGMDKEDERKESDFNIEAQSQSIWYEEQLKTDETSSGDNKGQAQQSCTFDLQSKQSNMSEIDELKALPPEQSASYGEEVVDPVRFVHVTDVRNTERNVDVSVEPSQPDDLTESSCEIKMSAENDEEKPESLNTIQDQGLKSDDAPVVAAADLEIVKPVIRGGAGEGYENDRAGIQELNDVDDVAHNKNLEMNSASPNLNSPNRRRKMGSTRRSLGSQTQDLHQRHGVDNDATETAANVGDVKSECLSGIKENELQPYIKGSNTESQQREEKEKVVETVERSHTGESYFKPPTHQIFEENPVSHGELIETEPQLTPNYLPAVPRTSPKHDLMSESAPSGRRRKMGSHRKSRGHQNNEDQTEIGDKITEARKGSDVTSITDESTTTTTEQESLILDKISEVDDPLSSTPVLEKHSRPKSEKTPERVSQHPYAGIRLGQQSQKTYSLGATSTANSYDVLMVGDSCVGKTSFIERAQSGKFSLDLPSSIGLDSSMWTVEVDGRPVVLRLWDTAGQERFHSLTRQIFHKAQAFLLMYDITSSQSFSAVSYWASCIQAGAAEDVIILLLGNKSDHAKRQVKAEQGAALATEYNFTFMECSAATGENVTESLETVARMLSQKVDTTEEVLLLHREPQQRKSSGCC